MDCNRTGGLRWYLVPGELPTLQEHFRCEDGSEEWQDVTIVQDNRTTAEKEYDEVIAAVREKWRNEAEKSQ